LAMKKLFRNIEFSPHYEYSSDSEHIPFEFYTEVFPVAKRVDMFLGYFNAYTFSILSVQYKKAININ